MSIIEEETVKLVVDQGIAEITINRPHSLNALNADVLQGLILVFEKLAKDPALRVAIVTGAGEKAFVAGADIASMAQLGPRAIADYVELGQRTMREIELLPVPVIAAVNGYALGGGMELALACDLIVAARSAKFGQPEVNLGVIPGFGGTQRLIYRCGVGSTRRLVYTGELIGADDALQLGLVDKICDAGEGPSAAVLHLAREIALGVAKKAPLAVRRAKHVIRSATEQLLLGGLRLEVEAFLELFKTADREEGMQAFLKKREANFTGR